MRQQRTIAAAIMTLGLAACDSAGRDWERARATNTTDAYVSFIRAHPDGTLAIEAKRAIDRLALEAATAAKNQKAMAALNDAKRHETVPAFRRVEREYAGTPAAELARQAVADLRAARSDVVRSVDRVAIVVNRQASLATVPIDIAAAEILALAGVERAAAEEGAAAVLRIEARGSGLGASYSRTGLPFDGTTWRETGAIVSGQIELEIRQPPAKLSRSFSGRVPVAEAMSFYGDPKPEPPPYFEASGLDHTGDPETTYHLRQSEVLDPASTMAVRLIELTRDLFGPTVTRAALTEPTRFRWAAVRAAMTLKDPRTADLLLDVFPNAGADRDYVVATLGQLREPRAVPLLLPLLKELVKGPAIKALGQIGDRRAALPLIELLAGYEKEGSDWTERDEVIDALERIAGKDFGLDIGAWRRWAQ